MEKILLPTIIKLRGQCKGNISTQLERTEYKALYRLSEKDYCECFQIRVAKEKIFQNGKIIKTANFKEIYPKDESFGIWAWSGKEYKIRMIYEALADH